MDLQDDNVLISSIFDYMIIKRDNAYHVCFGIQSYSDHSRFKACLFRTRRPIDQFKDFCEFMVSRHPNIIVPPLPFEEALPNEHPDILNAKIAQLDEYCKQLLKIPEVFNDPCLPLFYQTHLSMEEIRQQIAQREAEVANNGNDQQVEEENNGNDQQVEEENHGNGQLLGASNGNNNQQVLENKDGDHSSDGEFAAMRNASESETDEPIFRMDDI